MVEKVLAGKVVVSREKVDLTVRNVKKALEELTQLVDDSTLIDQVFSDII